MGHVSEYAIMPTLSLCDGVLENGTAVREP